ncbi:MAG TPA: hypothetical protein VF909_00960 [Roseiflexaceae bacterium]
MQHRLIERRKKLQDQQKQRASRKQYQPTIPARMRICGGLR